MKIILDVSAIIRRGLFVGEDPKGYEEVLEDGKTKWINTAQYGFDNTMNSLTTTFKNLKLNFKDVIAVLDGVNGNQLRRDYYSEYKAGREKSKSLYKEINSLSRRFQAEILALGGQVVQHDNVEADDLIGWFAQNIKEDKLLIITSDKDLLILAQYPNVGVLIGNDINPKPLGDFPFEFIDVYKATVGDSSDNIKGAKGFGPKSFEKLYEKFGDFGLKALRDGIVNQKLIDLQSDVPQLPVLQKLVDYSNDVYTSYKCVKLYTENVLPENMKWQHGMCSPDIQTSPFSKPWSATKVGVTSYNFDKVFREIKYLADENELVSLDIETTTTEESSDWLFTIKGKRNSGVDVFGSTITGLSLTLGCNFNKTYYFSVDHADTKNISLDDLDSVLKFLDKDHRFIIQNVNFELPILYKTFGWWLRDVDDTKLMASYVDENNSLGLKQNSERWLEYQQASYDDTVAIKNEDGEIVRLRKMDELTLDEVLDYGADDTICTAALYQWYQLHMMMEGVWKTYRDVEIAAAYWVAQAFLDGVKVDLVALQAMIKRDAELKAEQLIILNQYLISQGWEGTQLTVATADNYQTPTWIKYAFNILTGEELKTQVRKFDRLVDAVREHDGLFADILAEGNITNLNKLLKAKFSGEPQFNSGSPKQLQHLLYDVMDLPVRLRNKPTDNMRKAGVEGSPKTDELAISTAISQDLEDGDLRLEALKALQQIKMYETRESLYYNTYPHLPHWDDGLVHASLNQCATVTRRFSSSSPNLQQLAKRKGDFRKVFVPHKKNAMIVSLDFSAQELRVIADYSKDPNMLACYMSDEPKDMHSLTAAGIAKMTYEDFMAIYTDEHHPEFKWAKGVRGVAKAVNFASEYGVAAPKMAQTLGVSEEEAQEYLDAKYKAFAVSEAWKKSIISDAHKYGYATTKLGARRHLPELNNANSWEVGKAERQAVNFKIQSSSAEMTKLAMGRVWNQKIRQKYDIRFIAPIHDEMVFSISIEDMPKAIPEIYECMTGDYADMVVPIESSVSFGFNFGDQHELGDGVVPTEENITAKLAELLDENKAA